MKKLALLLFSVIAAIRMFAQCSGCSFISGSQAVGNATTVTIPQPIGVAANDVMVAAIHTGWCNSGSSVTPPAGWIFIAETGNTGPGCGAGSNEIQLATFYKVATASEPANYTFTGSSSQIYVGGIVAYSGVDVNNPVNAFSSNGAQEACNNIIAPGLTTTSSCTTVLSVFYCSVNNSLTNIVPQAGLTERLDIGTTGNHPWGNENVEISDRLITTTGPVGATSAALSSCSGSSWVTGAQQIALNCQPSVLADFDISDPVICQGGCINLTDQSVGDILEWQWLFEGADVTSFNGQNPGLVCYSNPGTYDITLTVTGPEGTDTFISTVTVEYCPVPGCTYAVALNYNPAANLDDGTCVFEECINNCPADLDGNNVINVNDLLYFMASFGTVCPD